MMWTADSWASGSNAGQYERSGSTPPRQPTPDRRVRAAYQTNAASTGDATDPRRSQYSPPRRAIDHSIPRGAEAEAESSQARGHGPQLAPTEEENEAVHERRVENEEPHHVPPRAEEQTWEQRFKSLQQELSRVKEVVKGRSPDTMDTLVQQTESPFTAEVLRYPLPPKFKMP